MTTTTEPVYRASVSSADYDTGYQALRDLTDTVDPHETIGFLTSWLASHGLANAAADTLRRAGWPH